MNCLGSDTHIPCSNVLPVALKEEGRGRGREREDREGREEREREKERI